MFIPVGLIAGLVSQQREQDQMLAMHHAAMMHENDKHNARAAETWYACTGPSAFASRRQAIALHDDTRARQRAEQAAGALIGAPVLSFEPITTLLGFHAFELAGKDRMRDAHAVLALGLAVLPDHPTLLGVLGELLMREGKRVEGAAQLERALTREAGLDDRLRSRVRELLA